MVCTGQVCVCGGGGAGQGCAPDLDAGLGGGAEPVAVGGEGEGVDDVTGIQGVQALALSQVPQHCNAILQGSSTGWGSNLGVYRGQCTRYVRDRDPATRLKSTLRRGKGDCI